MASPESLPSDGVRLSELVATISLGTDLGLGQPMEHVIRQTLIALRMSEVLGLDPSEREAVYYGGLLAWVGCHTDAYEQAKWFGDDIRVKAEAFQMAEPGPGWLLSNLGAGRSVFDRARLGVAFLGDGQRWARSMLETHWRTTDALAARLGLGDDVRQTLKESYERWDGKGAFGARGEQIRLSSRLVYLADVVAVFHASGGTEAAVRVARERSGSHFDPALVELFCDRTDALLEGLDAASSWDTVIEAEPRLSRDVEDAELDDALEALGDFSDLKFPSAAGHARGVGELAASAALGLGLLEADALVVRRAGFVHDIGRLGVPNAIWDKPGPLTSAETERVRLHPYLTGRMLASAPGLSPLGAIASQHHERLDGSGYPHGLSGDAISVHGRILGAADAYHAMTQLRPYRSPISPDDARAILRAEVRTGRLDGDVVEAVLQAAGHPVQSPDRPAGLTPREVQVLRLVARGLSNKQVAELLFISPKTAGNHVEHIYAKIGASNRAQAALFAMEHGLMTGSLDI